MPNLLGLQLSSAKLVMRGVIGVVVGIVGFMALYYIPSNPSVVLSQLTSLIALPKEASGIVGSLASQVIDPVVPPVGLAVTITMFLGAIFSKTKLEGPISIITNLGLVYFLYNLFRGGIIALNLPPGLSLPVTGQIKLEIPLVAQLIILPSLLNVIKGLLVTIQSFTKK